jgi:hypothetical protein
MAADDECHGPGITGRVGSHHSVATSAGRGREPGEFSVEPPPLTGGGLHAFRTRQCRASNAIDPLPAFGVVFRPFSLNGLSGHALGRIRTFDRLLAKLLYPTELHNSGGHPGVEPGTQGANHLMARISCFQRRGMCSTDGRIRMPHTGGAGVNPNP